MASTPVRVLVEAAPRRVFVSALDWPGLSRGGGPSDGLPIGSRNWPARYAARRIAWHVLDHAWEIEDRTKPGP